MMVMVVAVVMMGVRRVHQPEAAHRHSAAFAGLQLGAARLGGQQGCHIRHDPRRKIGKGIQQRRHEHVARSAAHRIQMQVQPRAQTLAHVQCASGHGFTSRSPSNRISSRSPRTSNPGRSRSSGSIASEA